MKLRLPCRMEQLKIAISLLLLIGGTRQALASRPLEPLPIPLYSFDTESPSLAGGAISADTVQSVDGENINGQTLGLGQEGDDIDGLSFNRGGSNAPTTFLILFSVTRATTGDVPVDPALRRLFVPFNVADQAERGHQAADGYLGTAPLTRLVAAASKNLRSGNSVEAINNYDEGGSHFEASPATSARTFASGVAQDDVDSMATVQNAATDGFKSGAGKAGGNPYGLYFTVTQSSPSLRQVQPRTLPGTSGADIFFDPEPRQAGQVLLFANHASLGLLPDDDIDAIVIFDDNANGVFDGDGSTGESDMILFSLAPGSPTLDLLADASPNAAADVFGIKPGMQQPYVFAPAASLGLVGMADDVNALEIQSLAGCDDPMECLARFGIRLVKGDWNASNDGQVNGEDFLQLLECLTGPKEGEGFTPPEPPVFWRKCREVYDFDEDGDVDLADFAGFQAFFGRGVIGVPWS